VIDRSSSQYRSALEEILRIYENQGFMVARIHADHEFKSTVEGLRNDSKLVSFNLANAQEHQPHAERNNRTIQERVRAVVHSLPPQKAESPYTTAQGKLLLANVLNTRKTARFRC
jgi:hypothetical protein